MSPPHVRGCGAALCGKNGAGAGNARVGTQHWEKFLEDVFSAESLDKYKGVLEENFSNVAQIEAVYISSDGSGRRMLDPRFFEELGVENPHHRQLFESWFAKECGCGVLGKSKTSGGKRITSGDSQRVLGSIDGADLARSIAVRFRGVSLEQWLWEVDHTGALVDVHRDHAVAYYDGLEQLIELYLDVGADGPTLDYAQLFADLGVEDRSHQRCLQSWFEKSCGVVPSLPRSASNGSKFSCFRGRAAHHRLGSDLYQWLDEVDWSHGSLAQYASAFADRFESPVQVTEQYKCTRPQGEQTVDERFFQDLGIQSADHRRLFELWFRRVNALSGTNSEASASDSTMSSESRRKRSSTNGRIVLGQTRHPWLRRINLADGSLAQYSKTLQQLFDSPEEIIEVYVKKAREGMTLDPQFFQDVGVSNVEHQLMFEAWFSGMCGAID